MKARIAAIAVGAGMLATIALAGCAGGTSPGTVKVVCDQPPVLGPDTATVAVLGQVGPEISYYDNDISLVLQGATDAGSRILVNGVGASNAVPNLVANVVMKGEGNNRMERDSNLECKDEAVTDAVLTNLASESGTAADAATGLDVLSAMMTLQDNLTSIPDGTTTQVVLFTSMLNSVGGVNLGDPASLSDVTGGLNTLASQSRIPDCSGWRVYAVGSDRDASLDAPGREALKEWWRQYFLRCGGELVLWAPHLDTFPTQGAGLAAADTQQIEVKEEGELVTAQIQGDLLFVPDGHDLGASADSQLEQLLTLVQSTKGPVVVTGHTDVGGDFQASMELSGLRADSVVAWLVAHDVDSSRVTSVKMGNTQPIYPNPENDDERQANRRVVVTIGNAQ